MAQTRALAFGQGGGAGAANSVGRGVRAVLVSITDNLSLSSDQLSRAGRSSLCDHATCAGARRVDPADTCWQQATAHGYCVHLFDGLLDGICHRWISIALLATLSGAPG